ncbi:unnamed protein product [Ectocarpus sp. 12 AP-2014]
MVLFPRTFDAVRWRYWCSNERNWLIALNSFSMASGVVLAASAVSLLLFTRYEEEEADGTDSTVYSTAVALAIMGCFQTVVAVIGIVAADKVSLHMMVFYFWLVALVIGSMFMWSIAALDFHFNFRVWLDKHWDDPALANVRDRLCANGTASDQCAVPPAGFPHGSPDLWCQAKYNSDECTAIKAEAVDKAMDFLSLFMNVAGGLSVSSVVEMLAALVLTVRVVTIPIIMRSMQSMINYLLVFPVVGAIVMGYVQSLHRPMLEVLGLVDLHYVVGALLLVVAVMGVLAGHLRHHLLLQVYMAGLGAVLMLYLVLITLGLVSWARLANGFDPDDPEGLVRIACEVGVHGCCCCRYTPEVDFSLYTVPGCPEWSDPKELAQVAIVFVKLGLLTSVMSVVFVLCGLWASVMFHNNLKGYQVDYI